MKKFETIDSKSISDTVLATLQGRILSGELKAGEWLPPEREMAEQMGVSRGSLHQAILSLEYQGFVSIVPRRGTVVCDYRKNPTPQSLAAIMSYGSPELDKGIFSDMMDFRMWLEAECARRACSNIYESTLFQMRSIAMNLGKQESDLTEETFRFHYLLTQASGNSVFSMIFRGFEPAVKALTGYRYEVGDTDISLTRQQMLDLVDSIAAKDEDEAENKLRVLLGHGIGQIEARYK